jgi:GNAT superfamily N-acetyltransferase
MDIVTRSLTPATARASAPARRDAPAIRPLSREDLPAVAALVQRGFPSEARRPGGAEAFLAATLLDHPWADADLPSLVAASDDGRIVGFIAVHARRLWHGDDDVRAAWCSHLVVDPDQRLTGLGFTLSTRFLSGPQDLSLSDTASDVVARTWRAVGGRVDPLRSLSWMRVLHRGRWAARLAVSAAARRRGSGLACVRPLPLELPARPPAPDGVELEPLSAEALAIQAGAIAASARVRPAYDVPFAAWLFGRLEDQMGAGRVVRTLVRRRGRPVGWFVYVRDAGGRGTVLEIAAGQRDIDVVADALFAAVAADGTLVLTGRLEPHLHDVVRRQRCAIGPGPTAVAHARDAALLAELASGRSLVTRLAGEWW